MSALLQMAAAEQRRFLIDAIPYNHWLGMEVLECRAGLIGMRMAATAHVRHPGPEGGIHEGAITALVDAACGSVALTQLQDVRRTATLDLRVDFLRPARAGLAVRCDAVPVQISEDLTLLRAIVHDGSEQDLVAVALGTFAIFRRPSVPDPAPIIDDVHRDAMLTGSYEQAMGVRDASDAQALRLCLPFAPHLVGNPQTRALHGGAIGALMQLAARAQLRRLEDPPNHARLFNLSVEYLAGTQGRETFATATLVSRSRRFANLRVCVYQDRPDHPNAVGTAQFLLLP